MRYLLSIISSKTVKTSNCSQPTCHTSIMLPFKDWSTCVSAVVATAILNILVCHNCSNVLCIEPAWTKDKQPYRKTLISWIVSSIIVQLRIYTRNMRIPRQISLNSVISAYCLSTREGLSKNWVLIDSSNTFSIWLSILALRHFTALKDITVIDRQRHPY